MNFSYNSNFGKSSIKGQAIPLYLKNKPQDEIISSFVQVIFSCLYIYAFIYFDHIYLKSFYALNFLFLFLINSPRSVALPLGGALKNHHKLKELRGVVFLSLINSLFNHFLFFRTEKFRNNPKWDLISFKLLFPSAALFIVLSSLTGANYEGWDFTTKSKEFYILAIIGSNYVASFTHLSASKSAKYKMLYDVYNKMLEARATKVKKDEFQEAFEIWETSLAIDILHFDMWAHKSFRDFFSYQIYDSLSYLKDSEINAILEGDDNHQEIRIVLKEINLSSDGHRYSIEKIGLILDYTYQLKSHKYHNEKISEEKPNHNTNNVLPFIQKLEERVNIQDQLLEKYFKSVNLK